MREESVVVENDYMHGIVHGALARRGDCISIHLCVQMIVGTTTAGLRVGRAGNNIIKTNNCKQSIRISLVLRFA
jgi:hypothetical protein